MRPYDKKLEIISKKFNFSINLIHKIKKFYDIIIIMDDCLATYDDHLSRQIKDIFYDGKHMSISYVI